MKMPPCPPDCPNRTIEPNCHSACKEYLDWRIDRDKENAAKKREYLDKEYLVKAHIRMRRVRFHGKQR